MNRFLGLDLRSLALCRFGVGLLVILDLITRAQSFRMHYTDEGVLPLQILFSLDYLRFPSIYAATSWEPFLVGLMIFHGLVALSLSLGYRTRSSTALVWYLTLSLQQRLYLANNGGDSVLTSVLFWGMFLPWGAVWSLDAAGGSDDPIPDTVSTPATTALMFQVVLMYWVSVLAKMEPTWSRGEILYYAFQNDFYAYALGQWLLPHALLMKWLAYGALAWEIAGPLLLLSGRPRARTFACFAFAVMHLGFGLFLRIGIFALTPILYAVALLPGWFWERPHSNRRAHTIARGFRWAATKFPQGSPEKPRAWKPWSSGLIYGLLVYTMLTSLSQDSRVGRILPRQLDWIGTATGLFQRWGVFVDMPRVLDGWYVMEGRLEDGREVDLFSGSSSLDWSKPSSPFTRYSSFRWPTPLVIMFNAPELQPWYARAFALDWERDHPKQKVVWVRINLMREQTQLDYRPPTLDRHILWEGEPVKL